VKRTGRVFPTHLLGHHALSAHDIRRWLDPEAPILQQRDEEGTRLIRRPLPFASALNWERGVSEDSFSEAFELVAGLVAEGISV
jgi:hypothetical protein